MRILIVNGYPNTPAGNDAFLRFQEVVQEVFLFMFPLPRLPQLGLFKSKELY